MGRDGTLWFYDVKEQGICDAIPDFVGRRVLERGHPSGAEVLPGGVHVT